MKLLFLFLFLGFILGQVASFVISGARISLLDIGVMSLLFGWTVFSQQKYRSLLIYTKIFIPFILAAAISLIVAAFSLPFGEVVYSSLYLVRFMLYSSLLMISFARQDISKLVPKSLFISGVLVAVLGLTQYIFYPDLRNLVYLGWDPHAFRVFSTFLDPNFTALILLLTLILGVYLLSNTPARKKIILLGIILTAIAFLLTYSRGGYVAFGVIAIFWLLTKKYYLKLFLGSLSFVVLLFLLPKPGGEGVDLLRMMSILSRLENNAEAWKIFRENPLIGVGFNTLQFRRLSTPPSINENTPKHSSGGFHNSYLLILATTGVVGFAAFLLLWKQVFERINFQKHTFVVFSLLAIFMHSLFDNSLFYPYVMFWMFLLCGWGFKPQNI